MTNNDVFKKLRVALMLRDEDILEILKLVDFNLGKSELGAFFRKEDHPNYRECGDQILRNFLNGLVLYLRGTKEQPKYPGDVLKRREEAAQTQNQGSDGKIKDFGQRQKKKAYPPLSPVKYKNKPSQSGGKKKS
ncbi:DUF1456 family protein [Flavobacteriaceae bacterium TP-CH-4]|uniref:DUF1456 family protein n=1 Tax=Pelagihabitans pacificus TaxID=2696054 RepID=A0A967ARG2_9FLAO|nr:DUF1456 family protein [Pelagihabitans pacificus]NHF57850.1 DUF1456 family protein [Pelagihabitans pacificus]